MNDLLIAGIIAGIGGMCLITAAILKRIQKK